MNSSLLRFQNCPSRCLPRLLTGYGPQAKRLSPQNQELHRVSYDAAVMVLDYLPLRAAYSGFPVGV